MNENNPSPVQNAVRYAALFEIADPSNPPSGCYFHPRCAHAVERCKIETTALRHLGDNHFAACHRAEEIELQGVIKA